MTYQRNAQPTTRQGLVTICVLVCLLVATSLAMLVMQSAIRERREMRLRLQMLQTEFLLDAGVQLARSRMSVADYQGETWIPDPNTTRFHNANITIELTDDGKSIKVVASLGATPQDASRIAALATRRSHIFSIATNTQDSE